MSKKLVELTAELVKEQISATPTTVDETEALLVRIFNTLQTIHQAEHQGGFIQALSEGSDTSSAAPRPSSGQLKPKDSIQQDKVICLECGAEFRQLTANHLKMHQMTHRDYKKKWGFRLKDSLSAKNLSANRSKKAKARGIPQQLKDYQETRRRGKATGEDGGR